VLQAHFNASKRELALVPELSGSEETLRDRYNVSYADQPYLFMPVSVTPATYYMRNAKFNLITINDKLLATTTLHPLLPELEFNPATIPSGLSIPTSKGVSKLAQLPFPITQDQTDFTFQGMSYTMDMLQSYYDNLYTGKVAAWNENGDKVESCEEYAYEKFYDFSLFKDFMALHEDEPLRVVEYAYRGSALDQNGIYITDDNQDDPGAIGTQCMTHLASSLNGGTGYDFMKRRGGDPQSIFTEMAIYYNKFVQGVDPNALHGISHFEQRPSPNISTDIFSDLIFSKNLPTMSCVGGLDHCVITENRNFMPKNFFVEVLGHISKTNTDRTKGIVLTDTGLLDLIGTPEMSYAMDCYNNNFEFHFLMLKSAQRLYSTSTALKNKLLEFKLLRKHLIQLMAERTRYENFSIILQSRPTQRILNNSETLPPSEKDYAAMKVDEYITTPAASKSQAGSKAIGIDDFDIIDIIDDIIPITSILKNIDDQIQAVLIDAREKGCLDLDISAADLDFGSAQDGQITHNYATLNTFSYPNSYTDETIDFLYDKALCDWIPEMLTETVITLIPDVYYENVYADCMRITGGDFQTMDVDNFRFRFPSQCGPLFLFNIFNPNTFNDYTENTLTFHQFESLIKKYPEAILDCDDIIQAKAKKALADADMNYYDPVTGRVMMSKSRSYYDSIGGQYANLEFGYAMGWLYEGYDDIAAITTLDIANRDFVCEKTGFFAFGNYFAGGSYLGHDFTLCSAGSYSSNKTSGASRPVPPTLADSKIEDKINSDINAVAAETEVSTTYFMFIKNEKMTFTYENDQLVQTPYKTTHSQPFSGDTGDYQSPDPEVQMLYLDAEKTIPICGFISIRVRGSVTGDIDADTIVNTDKQTLYVNDGCKTMNFAFTPYMDFDAFAQASITAGISGVASISAGVDIGLKFIGISFPYSTQLSITQGNGTADDRPFNYDIFVNVYNNLDQNLTLLSGYFGAFVKVEYLFGSDTYRQTLFSWDGIKFGGNVDRVGQNIDDVITPLAVPVKALYGLSESLYDEY